MRGFVIYRWNTMQERQKTDNSYAGSKKMLNFYKMSGCAYKESLL